MAIDYGIATIIAAIIASLTEIGITVGALGYSEQQEKELKEKIRQGKVTSADVTRLISSIKDKASVLGTNAANKLKSRINAIFNTYSISSGESEKVLAPIMNRLEKLGQEIDKLQSSASLHSSNAETAMSAFHAMSDKDKANARKILKDKPTEGYTKWKQLYKKLRQNKITPEERQWLKDNSEKGNYSGQMYEIGDYTDTEAGQTLKTAQEESEAAAADYRAIEKLAEENM